MITSKSDTVGVIYLDSRQTAVDLSSGNRELLQTLALEASTVLENARLLEEERVKHRMEEELGIAREIQSSLLPRKLPSEGWFRAAGSSIPSHAVGGDCFDCGKRGRIRWAAVVTDVSGKGREFRAARRVAAGRLPHWNPRAGWHRADHVRINQFLYERTEGEKYATVFYCVLEKSGRMVWTNAGHVTPYLVRPSGELKALDTTGLPLGMLDTSVFGVEITQLEPGDKLVAFSDGLTEAQDAKGAFFETKRLKELLRTYCATSAAELHAAVMGDVEKFTGGAVQSDDITALVLEYRP